MRSGYGSCFGGLLSRATCAVFVIAVGGCASQGSSFDTPATGSGGAVGSGSGGATGSGSGGTTGSGSGGSDPTGIGTGAGGSSGAGGAAGQGGGTASGGATGRGGATGAGGSPDAGTSTGGAGGTVVAPACPKPAGQICHEFYANDNSRNQLSYVNEFTGKSWTVNVGDTTANSPRTMEIVDNPRAKTGRAVLVSLNRGYGEFDVVDGTSLVKVLNFTGVSGACRIPDGTTALGTNDIIHIVTATGSEMRNFRLPAGPELRAINRNPTTGNFWFSKTDDVFEVTAQGAQVWTAYLGAGTKGYAVWWRDGGGAYATTGDPSTVVEVNAAGAIVSQVGGKTKFPFLDFFSGFVRRSNGNYVVANWLGHLQAPAGSTPHLVELNPQNELVWQWGNQTLARQITNVYLIR